MPETPKPPKGLTSSSPLTHHEQLSSKRLNENFNRLMEGLMEAQAMSASPLVDDLVVCVAMANPRNAIDYALAYEDVYISPTADDAVRFLRAWAAAPTSADLKGYRAWLTGKIRRDRRRLEPDTRPHVEAACE